MSDRALVRGARKKRIATLPSSSTPPSSTPRVIAPYRTQPGSRIFLRRILPGLATALLACAERDATRIDPPPSAVAEGAPTPPAAPPAATGALPLTPADPCAGGACTAPPRPVLQPAPGTPTCSGPSCAPLRATLHVPAAHVSVTPLAELGLPSSLLLATPPAEPARGGPAALVSAGAIVIATPGDIGREQTFTLELADIDGARAELTLVVDSARPLDVFSPSEAGEDGSASPPAPPLVVSGLGQGNLVGSGTLQLGLPAGPAVAPELSRFQVADASGAPLDVSSLFRFDAAANLFSMDLADLRSAIAGLSGLLELSANLVSSDYEFAQNYSFPLLVPSTRILGQLVDPQGAPLRGPASASLSIGVVGLTSDVRRVVPVAEDGSFFAEELVSETYRLVVMDLTQPNVFVGFVALQPGNSEARVQLTYAPSLLALLSSPADVQAFRIGGALGSTARGRWLHAAPTAQAGARPAATRRGRRSEPSEPLLQGAAAAIAPELSGCPISLDGETYFTVTSGAEGVDQSCALAFTATEAAVELAVEIEVFSEEFPDYTQSDSEFNDAWSYSLNADNAAEPVALEASGKVNDTHALTGAVTRRVCIQAPKDSAGNPVTDPPLSLQGSLLVQNVGDGDLPTRVAVRISESCRELAVTRAELTTPSAAGHPLLAPLRINPTNGNRDGHFISLPTGTPDGNEYELPLMVEYAPKDAEIQELTLAVIRGGVLARTVNLLDSGAVAANGKIELAGVVLPPLPDLIPDGRSVGLAVRLAGTIQGVFTQSAAAEPNVFFRNQNSFTPLWLAEDALPSASRRYGQGRDEWGDDNWALLSTIAYLRQSSFRFNDISAQHATQTVSGKSILGHAGHSDGTQVDLRYMTGSVSNPYGDGGNEAAHLALVQAAFNECFTTATTAQQRLVDWISVNRAMLTAEARWARKIYIANGPVGLALVEGRYPNPIQGPLQPGGSFACDQILIPPGPGQLGGTHIGRWSMPPVVAIQEGHVDHWHIALQ